jgi:hypothetical protein
MPPSNYFSKVFDGTVEDEDDIEEKMTIKLESIKMICCCPVNPFMISVT